MGPDWAGVSVGGVTFRVNVPGSAVDDLGPVGARVRLHTCLQVREDNLTLFGFLTEDDRLAFEALIGINGVGPRVALSVLSRLTPAALAVAVSSGDTAAFTSVSGVGKKIASRIVLELRGKLEKDWAVPGAAIGGDVDVFEALTALGYTAPEAREAITSLPSGNSMSVEDRVRLALQHFAAR